MPNNTVKVSNDAIGNIDDGNATIDDVKDVMDDLTSNIDIPDDIHHDEGNPDDKKSDADKQDTSDKNDKQDIEEDLDDNDLIDDLTGVSDKDDTPKDDEPEESEEHDEELLKDASQEVKSAFIGMRKMIRDLQTKAKESAGTEDPEVVAELRNKISDLENQLGSIDISKSPEFQRQYTVPIRKELNTIGSAIKEIGSDPKEIINRALSFKSKIERKKFLEERVPSFATELSIMFTRVDSMMDARRQAMKNHIDTKKSLAISEARRNAETFGKVFDTTLEDLRSKNHFLYKETPDDKKNAESWNTKVKSRIESARNLISQINTDHNKLVNAALKASIADELLSLFIQERKSRIALESQLSKRKNMSPNIRGDSSQKRTRKDESDTGPLEAEDVADIIAGKDYGSGSLPNI